VSIEDPRRNPPRGLPKPATRHGSVVHVLVDAAAAPAADIVVFEQDTSAVLSPPCGIGEPRESMAALVEQMTRQRRLQAGTVLSRCGDPLRLYAVVHDLACEPSWCGDWVRACLSEILQVAEAEAARTLVLPTLGAVHGRYPVRAFVADLRQALRRHGGPADLWLLPPARKLGRLCQALAGEGRARG